MRFALLVAGLAAVLLPSFGNEAVARDGCGRGAYFNGYACVAERRGPPQGAYYAPGYGGQRYYNPDAPRGPYFNTPRDRQGGCPPGYEWNPRYRSCTSNFR